MKVNVDKVGVIASTICAVHCVLTGLALGLLSVLGLGFIGNGWTELFFVALTISLGTVAVVHGIRKHHSPIPALIFIAGLTCMIVSHFVFGHDHGHEGHKSLGTTVFSVLGGLSLVIFHIVNLSLASRCGCTHCKTGQ